MSTLPSARVAIERIEAAWKSIDDDLAHGRYDAALQTCAVLLDESPDEGRAWMLRGLALHGEGAMAEACRALETASTLTPLSAEAQFALADCYARQSRADLAAATCEPLLERDELPDHLWPNIARLYASWGGNEGALRACQRAAALNPWSDGAYFGAAHYMSRLGYAPRLVLSVLGRAFTLRPQFVPYRLAMARLLDTLDRPAEAFALLQALPAEEFSRLKCRGCLERLINLFLRFKDDRRAAACTQALASASVRSPSE